jgi:ABC-2 type transport system permease protein
MSEPRSLGAARQWRTLYRIQLLQILRARKSYWMLAAQIVPVLVGLAFAIWSDRDGSVFFRDIVEHITIPFFVPLAALFYGAPSIVDEMEGRTLTYLMLRPIPRPVLYLAKVCAGLTVAVGAVVIPMVLLFVVCVAKSNDFAATLGTLGQLCAAATLGTMAYGSVFAMLGALFATSMLPSILFFVLFEMILGVLPVLELASVRYYVKTMGGLKVGDRLGPLEELILTKPLLFSWWVGLIVLALVTFVASSLGAYIFREKQYYV